MAPREACVTRHWHLEKDGTYVVLCQSTEHPQVSNLFLAKLLIKYRFITLNNTKSPLDSLLTASGADSALAGKVLLGLKLQEADG